MSVLLLLLSLAALGFAGYNGVRSNGSHYAVHFGRMLPGLMLSLLCFSLMLAFTTVDAGTRAVVTRFGSVMRTLQPGAHLLVPFAETAHEINVQTQTVKPSEDASSNDLQVVHTEVTLAYHYDPRYADFTYQQLGGDGKDSVIIPAILEAIKSQTAQFNAAELISKRPAVRDNIDNFVTQRLAPYHVVIETVSITDFHFSKDYEDAIEAKVTAIQKAEQAQNDLNRVKIEAEQKVAAAEGEAQALAAQKQQITPELLQLRTIEMMKDRWDGHLPEYYGSTPLPMMNALQNKATK